MKHFLLSDRFSIHDMIWLFLLILAGMEFGFLWFFIMWCAYLVVMVILSFYVKPLKIKPKMFNFEDGNGLVPANRHINTNGEIGGWVAETAEIEDTAHVGENARVFENAKVFGNANISDYAKVYGNAHVYGNAKVYDYAEVYGHAEVYGNAEVCDSLLSANRSDNYTFAIFHCSDSVIRISAGCRYFTIPEAIDHWTNGERKGTKLGKESISIVNHLNYSFNLTDD